MERAFKIATLAHGYALLARRPELWTNNVGERITRATSDEGPGRLSAFDAILVAQSGSIDRLCAYAVVVLSRKGGRTSELLDVLGMLDADRVLAIYYALPDDRRAVVARDNAWAFHISRAPAAEIVAVLHELQALGTEPISAVSSVTLAGVCGVGGAAR
jgi:hypothetical protein